MSKKRLVLIIILAVACSWLFNLLLGRFVAAKLSTWPVLNRWGIISPQAPIVITTKETVRVSDGTDPAAIAAAAKSKICSLIAQQGNVLTVLGGCLNLTSDGAFVTAASVFPTKTTNSVLVLLNDGRSAQIAEKTIDPATGLIFFRAKLDSVPTVNFGDSREIQPGERLFLPQISLKAFAASIETKMAFSSESDNIGKVWQSDLPRRGFTLNSVQNLSAGQVLLNTSGEVVGIYNGSEIISSDVLKQAFALYFNNNRQIVRPAYGFSYEILDANTAQILSLTPGLLIKDVGGPAKSTGLLQGDIVTAIDGQSQNAGNSPEAILQNHKPGDKVFFAVLRNENQINLTLTVGTLK